MSLGSLVHGSRITALGVRSRRRLQQALGLALQRLLYIRCWFQAFHEDFSLGNSGSSSRAGRQTPELYLSLCCLRGGFLQCLSLILLASLLAANLCFLLRYQLLQAFDFLLLCLLFRQPPAALGFMLVFKTMLESHELNPGIGWGRLRRATTARNSQTKKPDHHQAGSVFEPNFGRFLRDPQFCRQEHSVLFFRNKQSFWGNGLFDASH